MKTKTSLIVLILTIVFAHAIFAQQVGITNTNTFTPNYLLHVHDANTATPGSLFQLTTSGTGTSTSDGFHIGVTSGWTELRNKENAGFQLFTNDVERVRINAVGRMLIPVHSTPTLESRLCVISDNANGSPSAIQGGNENGVSSGFLGSSQVGVYGVFSSTTAWGYGVWGQIPNISGISPTSVGVYGSYWPNIAGLGYNNTGASGISGVATGGAYQSGVKGVIATATNRASGVNGYQNGSWGALGYRNSGGTDYGVYYATTIGNGAGKSASANAIGIGGCGDIIGSWTKGNKMGSISWGNWFASYNLGNEFTSGFQADIVEINNSRNVLYSTTSTELKVNYSGVANLVNGKATIMYSSAFYSVVNWEDVSIIITPYGNTNGLYVLSFNQNGCEIRENSNGSSSVQFSYMIIGTRKDSPVVSPEVLKNGFEQNIKSIMTNENDDQTPAGSLDYDGTQLIFSPVN